jgi:hypothetical protein
VVAALCAGERLFNEDTWEHMTAGRNLSTGDFVVLDIGKRFAVPCCGSGGHVSSALAELSTAYTFGQDGGTSSDSTLELPWDPSGASHEAFEALLLALADERLAERRRAGREKRSAAKEEEIAGVALVLGEQHTTRSGASFSHTEAIAQPPPRTRSGRCNVRDAPASSSCESGEASSSTSTAVEPPDFVVAPLTRPGASRELRGMHVCMPYEEHSGAWTRYFGVVAEVSDALQEVHITFPYQVHLGNDESSARFKLNDINSKFCYLVPQEVAFQQWNGWRPVSKTRRKSLQAKSSAEAGDVSASDELDEESGSESAASDDSFELDPDEADIDEVDRRLYDALIHDINLANWRCARSQRKHLLTYLPCFWFVYSLACLCTYYSSMKRAVKHGQQSASRGGRSYHTSALRSFVYDGDWTADDANLVNENLSNWE